MAELKKIEAKQASEILTHFELSEEGAHCAEQATLPPADFLKLLLESALYFDAVKFLAHALPQRESIWWCCLATKASISPDAPAAEQAALNAAEQWAIQPTEDNRQLAKHWSEQTKQKSAASWAATAAFWTSGSMAKPGEPEVPPPPYLYAHAVSGAVSMAAFALDPENAAEPFQRFIRQGVDLACGGRGDVA